MTRLVARWFTLAAVIVSVGAAPARGQSPGAVATFAGTLSSGAQRDHFAFEVGADRFVSNASGAVAFVFVMTGAPGSLVDPGVISIVARDAGRVDALGPARADTAGGAASLALVSLSPGAYELIAGSEQGTTGAYRLDVFLAGDANGDLQVDGADVAAIAGARAGAADDAPLAPLADVNRDGVVDGTDLAIAEKNVGAMVRSGEAGNRLETFLPAGALAPVGLSAGTFNPRAAPLRFRLAGAEFDVRNVAEFTLTINGAEVGPGALTAAAHLLTANVGLDDGRNDVALKAYDAVGRPLYYRRTLWAGTATLRVRLVNPDGSPFLQPAIVVATLADDRAVAVTAVKTTTGAAVFEHVPSRRIRVEARGAGGERGLVALADPDGEVTVTMGGGASAER